MSQSAQHKPHSKRFSTTIVVSNRGTRYEVQAVVDRKNRPATVGSLNRGQSGFTRTKPSRARELDQVDSFMGLRPYMIGISLMHWLSHTKRVHLMSPTGRFYIFDG